MLIGLGPRITLSDATVRSHSCTRFPKILKKEGPITGLCLSMMPTSIIA